MFAKNLTWIPLVLAALVAIGCGNTAEGLAEDTERNSQEAAKQADKAIESLDGAGEKIEAATLLTPRIKSAISADADLNDERNLIDVDSTPEEVVLSGHVHNDSLRDRAEKIALEELREANAKQKLRNELVVK